MERRRFPRLPERHGFLLTDDQKMCVGQTVDWSEGGYAMRILEGDPPAIGLTCLVYVPELARLGDGTVVSTDNGIVRVSISLAETAPRPERRRYPRLPADHGFILTDKDHVCVGQTVDWSPGGYCMRVIDGPLPAVDDICLVHVPERLAVEEGRVVDVTQSLVRVAIQRPYVG